MTETPYAANPLKTYSYHLIHRWGIWQQYEHKAPGIYEGRQIQRTAWRQKRHCVICGFEEDQWIRDG